MTFKVTNGNHTLLESLFYIIMPKSLHEYFKSCTFRVNDKPGLICCGCRLMFDSSQDMPKVGNAFNESEFIGIWYRETCKREKENEGGVGWFKGYRISANLLALAIGGRAGGRVYTCVSGLCMLRVVWRVCVGACAMCTYIVLQNGARGKQINPLPPSISPSQQCPVCVSQQSCQWSFYLAACVACDVRIQKMVYGYDPRKRVCHSNC